VNIFLKVKQVECALEHLINAIQELQEETKQNIQDLTSIVVTEGCSPDKAQEYLEDISYAVHLEIVEEKDVYITLELLDLIAKRKA